MMVRPLKTVKEDDMSHIGTIIENYRHASGMSRKELSENICTEKHIYLIERGERSPSVTILKMLGDRIGVDLLKFYPYLNCDDPVAVYKKIQEFHTRRVNIEFEQLNRITDEAEKMPDFSKMPWSLEIKLNRLYYSFYEKKQYDETSEKLKKLLKEAEPIYTDEMFIAGASLVFSSCCFITGDIHNAQIAAENAYNTCLKNKDVDIDEKFFTTIVINLLGAKYINGEFDTVIEKGNEFLDKKYKVNSFDRLHYVYFFVSCSYYAKHQYKEAMEVLKKAIYLLMLDYRPADVGYIALDPRFNEMLNDFGRNSELIQEFREKYKI